MVDFLLSAITYGKCLDNGDAGQKGREQACFTFVLEEFRTATVVQTVLQYHMGSTFH